MNLNLQNIDIPVTKEYSSGSKHEPIELYLDGLSNSNRFDLLLGYFSTSAINLLSYGFTKFLANGGNMRLVINQFLTQKDKEALTKGVEKKPEEIFGYELSLSEIRKNLDEGGEHFFNCIAWLIAKKRIDIKIVKPKAKSGIAHYKSGVFSDGKNFLKFKGSCNFTANALLNNLEEIEVKCSWDEADLAAIKEYQTYFEEIFCERATFIEYLDSKNIEEVIINEFGDKDLRDLIIDEKKLIEKKRKLYSAKTIKTKIDTIRDELIEIERRPRFPYDQGPRKYQEKAYKKWVENEYKGVFAMATGTGKTITALNCLLELYNVAKVYQAIVLVPTVDLQNQWVEEIEKFNIRQGVILVGAERDWKKKLSKLTTTFQFGGTRSFIIVSTYNSFGRNSLQSFLKYLPEETLLIADEAHNIAAPSVLKRLSEVIFKRRIGLSATPKRVYDLEGTDEMNSFFNDSPPYTFEYTMEEAIAKGVLCQYDYYPHVVELTDEEFEKYIEITKKISRLYAFESSNKKEKEILDQLLMKRKRIIHKAENKIPKFKEILKREYLRRKNLKYTFVYVPEGFDESDLENERMMVHYNQAIMNTDPSLRVASFNGETKERVEILNSFEKGEIDVVSAMKCLDEGVDVPRAELAIFCSSTGNPRQFVQRRGRILRQHDDKKHAVIHDLVVVPKKELGPEKGSTFELERTQVANELKRVADFAFLSRNQFEAVEMIQSVCDYYDLNLQDIKDEIKL